jgi:hypothetical protein
MANPSDERISIVTCKSCGQPIPLVNLSPNAKRSGEPELSIGEHSLICKPLEKLMPLVQSMPTEDLMIKSSKVRHSRAPKLSNEQNYHHYVLWYAYNMVKLFRLLNHIVVYIKDFPKPKSYLKQGITQYDWIQYHYHVYMVSIVGLYEAALKLTNGVFRLGIDEKQVKESIIKENLWVKSTGVSEALRTFRQATSHIRVPRNLFLHGGDLLKLEDLDTLDIVCMASKVQLCEYPPDVVKDIFQVDIDKRVDKMSSEISSMESHAMNLFDKLLPIYNFHASVFETIEASSRKKGD